MSYQTGTYEVSAVPAAAPRVRGPARRGGLLVAAIICAGGAALLAALTWPSFRQPLILGAVAVTGFLLAAKRLSGFVTFFVVYMFFDGVIKNVSPVPLTFFFRDIFLSTIYLVWFVRYPLRRGVRGRYDKFAAAAVGAFVFYTLVVTFIPLTGEPFLYRLGGARWWLAFVPLFFVAADVLGERRRFDRLCYTFVAAAAVTSVYGVLQYLFGFEHLLSISPHYESVIKFGQFHGLDVEQAFRRRVFATFNLPSFFAMALHVACLLTIACLAQARRPAPRVVFAAAFVLFLVALAFTGCRSAGYVTLVTGLVIYGWLERRRDWLWFALPALALGFGVVMLLSEGNYLYRLLLIVTDYDYTWRRISDPVVRAVALVRDHPFGLGIATSAKVGRIFSEWEETAPFTFIENGFGQALVSLGWPGVALFTLMLLVIPVRLARLLFGKAKGAEWRVAVAFAVCVSASVTMFTSMAFYDGLRPVMYWLLAGAAMSVGRTVPADDEDRVRM